MFNVLKAKKQQSHFVDKGCSQCKKSNIKCDKGHPLCKTCAKKNAICTYELTFINENVTKTKARAIRRRSKVKRLKNSGIGTPISVRNGNRTSSSSSSLERSYPLPLKVLETRVVESLPVKTEHDLEMGEQQALASLSLIEEPQDIGDIYFQANLPDVAAFSQTLPMSPALYDENTNRSSYAWTDYGEKPQLWKSFDLDWRTATWLEIIQALEAYDPINHMDPTFFNNYSNGAVVNHSQTNFISFVWTMAKSSQLFGNLPMFPEENLNNLMEILWKMDAVYPIVHETLVYNCAVFFKRIYQNFNEENHAYLWDKILATCSLNLSLQKLDAQLTDTKEFAELVAILFANTLSRASDTSFGRLEQSAFLLQCYRLIKQIRIQMPQGSYISELDLISISLFEFLEEWFCQTEIMTYIILGCDGIVTDITEMEYLIDKASPKLSTFQQRFGLTKGCQRGFDRILLRICLKIMQLKSEGYAMNMGEILNFKLLHSVSPLPVELHSFASDLLEEIKSLNHTSSETIRLIQGITDYRLHIDMKNSNHLYFLGLQLYLKAVFMNAPLNVPELKELLEQILEAGLAIKYNYTGTSLCYFFIYLSAEASLLICNQVLYKNFTDLLQRITDNNVIYSKSIQKVKYTPLLVHTNSDTPFLSYPINYSWE